MSKQNVLQKQNPEAFKAQKRRNMWLALALITFVVLMGVGTAIRISEGAGTDACEGALYWDMSSNSCTEAAPEPDLEAIAEGEPG